MDYLLELEKYCDHAGLAWKYVKDVTYDDGICDGYGDNGVCDGTGVDVIFRTSISSAERTELFSVTKALLYTPDKEHFGIVPIEVFHAVWCSIHLVHTVECMVYGI